MKKKEINYQLLIRRICLIVLDIICIIAASILALLTRFEFDFSQIPKEFLKVIYKYGPFTIVITLIIFTLFRIYSSLWEYAGIEEVFSLIAACLAAAVAKLVIISFTWSVMPRSWYVLDTIYLMILIGATRVSYRLIRLRRQNRTFPWSKRKKVMIIGGGEAGRKLLGCNAFFGFENDKNIATGLGFGAEARNKTIHAMMNQYIEFPSDKEGNFPIIKCPELNTKALLPYGLKLNGKYQKLDGAEVFPYDYFNPYDDPTGKLNKTENTVSIHWYSKSWMDKKTILRSKITKPFHRIFGVDCFKRLKK